MINLPANPKGYFYCPKCGSRNLAAVFSILVGGTTNSMGVQMLLNPEIYYTGRKKYPLATSEALDRCQDCKHEDIRGNFENENRISERDRKINNILND